MANFNDLFAMCQDIPVSTPHRDDRVRERFAVYIGALESTLKDALPPKKLQIAIDNMEKALKEVFK